MSESNFTESALDFLASATAGAVAPQAPQAAQVSEAQEVSQVAQQDVAQGSSATEATASEGTTETSEVSFKDAANGTSFAAVGAKALEADAEAKKKLFTKSDDVEFIELIGDPSKIMDRKFGSNGLKDAQGKAIAQTAKCFKGVGAIFKNKGTEPISVPRISDVRRTCKTGFGKGELSYITVQPGETFDVTYLELLLFASQPEYSLCFSFKGQSLACKVVLKTKNFEENSDKCAFPMTTIICQDFAAKSRMKAIATKEADGKYKVLPEFARYAPLYEEKKRVTNKKATQDKNVQCAITAASVRVLVKERANIEYPGK